MKASLPATDCLVLVVDLQDRLIRALAADARKQLVDNCLAIRAAADRCEVPLRVTELEPRSFGRTLPQLSALPNTARDTLSACDEALRASIEGAGREVVVLVGLEVHVALLQTALDLLRLGHRVALVADAAASRGAVDAEWALRRLADAGVVITTTESLVLEWARDARSPLFHELFRARRHDRS